MPNIDVFAVIGIIMVFILLGVLVLIPTGKKPKSRKRKKTEDGEEVSTKDWEAVSQRLEKHILTLRGQIEGLEKKGKNLERDLMVQKEKYSKVQEKLNQEKRWQNKEVDEVKKKTEEVKKLKEDIRAIEANLEKEHSQRLKLEREDKLMKKEIEKFKEDKRVAESELAKTKAQGEAYRDDIKELRSENQKLQKKRDAETWIAKDVYDKLQQEFKDMQREFNVLKEKYRKEML